MFPIDLPLPCSTRGNHKHHYPVKVVLWKIFWVRGLRRVRGTSTHLRDIASGMRPPSKKKKKKKAYAHLEPRFPCNRLCSSVHSRHKPARGISIYSTPD